MLVPLVCEPINLEVSQGLSLILFYSIYSLGELSVLNFINKVMIPKFVSPGQTAPLNKFTFPTLAQFLRLDVNILKHNVPKVEFRILPTAVFPISFHGNSTFPIVPKISEWSLILLSHPTFKTYSESSFILPPLLLPPKPVQAISVACLDSCNSLLYGLCISSPIVHHQERVIIQNLRLCHTSAHILPKACHLTQSKSQSPHNALKSSIQSAFSTAFHDLCSSYSSPCSFHCSHKWHHCSLPITSGVPLPQDLRASSSLPRMFSSSFPLPPIASELMTTCRFFT